MLLYHHWNNTTISTFLPNLFINFFSIFTSTEYISCLMQTQQDNTTFGPLWSFFPESAGTLQLSILSLIRIPRFIVREIGCSLTVRHILGANVHLKHFVFDAKLLENECSPYASFTGIDSKTWSQCTECTYQPLAGVQGRSHWGLLPQELCYTYFVAFRHQPRMSPSCAASGLE